MKICVNGITRDMTAEEEVEYLHPAEEPTAEDKAEAYDILMGVNNDAKT